jgi:hypothetical protein
MHLLIMSLSVDRVIGTGLEHKGSTILDPHAWQRRIRQVQHSRLLVLENEIDSGLVVRCLLPVLKVESQRSKVIVSYISSIFDAVHVSPSLSGCLGRCGAVNLSVLISSYARSCGLHHTWTILRSR